MFPGGLCTLNAARARNLLVSLALKCIPLFALCFARSSRHTEETPTEQLCHVFGNDQPGF